MFLEPIWVIFDDFGYHFAALFIDFGHVGVLHEPLVEHLVYHGPLEGFG